MALFKVFVCIASTGRDLMRSKFKSKNYIGVTFELLQIAAVVMTITNYVGVIIKRSSFLLQIASGVITFRVTCFIRKHSNRTDFTICGTYYKNNAVAISVFSNISLKRNSTDPHIDSP